MISNHAPCPKQSSMVRLSKHRGSQRAPCSLRAGPEKATADRSVSCRWMGSPIPGPWMEWIRGRGSEPWGETPPKRFSVPIWSALPCKARTKRPDLSKGYCVWLFPMHQSGLSTGCSGRPLPVQGWIEGVDGHPWPNYRNTSQLVHPCCDWDVEGLSFAHENLFAQAPKDAIAGTFRAGRL